MRWGRLLGPRPLGLHRSTHWSAHAVAQLAIGKKERDYCKLELPAEMACGAIHVAKADEAEMDHPALAELLATIQRAFPSKASRDRVTEAVASTTSLPSRPWPQA